MNISLIFEFLTRHITIIYSTIAVISCSGLLGVFTLHYTELKALAILVSFLWLMPFLVGFFKNKLWINCFLVFNSILFLLFFFFKSELEIVYKAFIGSASIYITLLLLIQPFHDQFRKLTSHYRQLIK